MNVLLKAFGLMPDDAHGRIVLGWQTYDWADSPTVIVFNYFMPKLITSLAKTLCWQSEGKALWSYLTGAATIISLFGYVTVCSAAEYGSMKKRLMLSMAKAGAICLGLCIFVLFKNGIWLAAGLFLGSKVLSRTAGLLYDAMLDDISKSPAETQSISATGYIIGYFAMAVYAIIVGGLFVLPANLVSKGEMQVCPAAGVAASNNTNTQTQSQSFYEFHPLRNLLSFTIPISCAGLWWYMFSRGISVLVPDDLVGGKAFPPWVARTVYDRTRFWVYQGVKDQVESLYLCWREFRDVGFFLFAWMLLSDCSSTAMSVGVLVAEHLGIPDSVVIASALIGFISAPFGVIFFKRLNHAGVSPKTILIINTLISMGAAICVLFVGSQTKEQQIVTILVVALVVGSQIGSIGSFTRGMLSSLAPAQQQSQLFSLFELTQKGTSWLGPLIIASVLTALGDEHYVQVVVYVILAEAVLGLPVFIWFVDEQRGIQKRKEYELKPPTAHGSGGADQGGQEQVKTIAPSTAFAGTAATQEYEQHVELASTSSNPTAKATALGKVMSHLTTAERVNRNVAL